MKSELSLLAPHLGKSSFLFCFFSIKSIKLTQLRHLYRSVKYWFNFSLSCQKIDSHLTPEEYFWKCVTEIFSCIFQNNIWIRRVVTIRKEQIMKMQIICPGVVTTYWSNNDAKIQIIVKTIFLNNLDSCLFQECSPDVYQIKVLTCM